MIAMDHLVKKGYSPAIC